MCKDLLSRVYLLNKETLFEDIISYYTENKFCIINFIYFASLSSYILEKNDILYEKSLLNSSFLLPDGIALKLYLKKYSISIQENLNGTDFTPFLLSKLKNKKIHIAYYSVYDEKIGKSKKYASNVGDYIKKKYSPDGFFGFVSHYKSRGVDFDFNLYKKSFLNKNFDYKFFLVGLGTPFQEKWIYENKNFFIENNIIVLNVGGLFDFWVGFEKRAPKVIRKLNLEWLWRLGQNPKKNLNKVKESFKLFKYLLK